MFARIARVDRPLVLLNLLLLLSVTVIPFTTGLLAGYLGPVWSYALMRLTDVMITIPVLVIAAVKRLTFSYATAALLSASSESSPFGSASTICRRCTREVRGRKLTR